MKFADWKTWFYRLFLPLWRWRHIGSIVTVQTGHTPKICWQSAPQHFQKLHLAFVNIELQNSTPSPAPLQISNHANSSCCSSNSMLVLLQQKLLVMQKLQFYYGILKTLKYKTTAPRSWKIFILHPFQSSCSQVIPTH